MKYKIFLLCLLFILLFLGFTKVLASGEIPLESPIIVQVKTSPLFEKIALCESGNDPHQKNLHSSASGRFQFIFNTWYNYGLEFWGEAFYEKNVFNYQDNTDLAWYVFQKYGTRDWDASKHCWGSLVVDS